MTSPVLVINLSDSDTQERLYAMHPEEGRSMIPFEELVQAATEIATANKNSYKSFSGSVSHSQSNMVNYKKQCNSCGKIHHNREGFD